MAGNRLAAEFPNEADSDEENNNHDGAGAENEEVKEKFLLDEIINTANTTPRPLENVAEESEGSTSQSEEDDDVEDSQTDDEDEVPILEEIKSSAEENEIPEKPVNEETKAHVEENESDVLSQLPSTPRPKSPASSLVHCLAGVQELPDFLTPTKLTPLVASGQASQIGCASEHKRSLNMGQQTEPELEPTQTKDSAASKGYVLGTIGDEVEDEAPAVVSAQIEHVEYLSPNRPTTPTLEKIDESDDEESNSNLFDKKISDEDEEDSDPDKQDVDVPSLDAPEKEAAQNDEENTPEVEVEDTIEAEDTIAIENDVEVENASEKENDVEVENPIEEENDVEEVHAKTSGFLPVVELSDPVLLIVDKVEDDENNEPEPEVQVIASSSDSPVSGKKSSRSIKKSSAIIAIRGTKKSDAAAARLAAVRLQKEEQEKNACPSPKKKTVAHKSKDMTDASILDHVCNWPGTSAVESGVNVAATASEPGPRIPKAKNPHTVPSKLLSKQSVTIEPQKSTTTNVQPQTQQSRTTTATAPRWTTSTRSVVSSSSTVRPTKPTPSGRVQSTTAAVLATAGSSKPVGLRGRVKKTDGSGTSTPTTLHKTKAGLALADPSTSDAAGSGSGVDAETSAKSGTTRSASGSYGGEKSRLRKCSTDETGGAAAKPKTRTKPSRPITQPPAQAQRRKEKESLVRPTTAASAADPNAKQPPKRWR